MAKKIGEGAVQGGTGIVGQAAELTDTGSSNAQAAVCGDGQKDIDQICRGEVGHRTTLCCWKQTSFRSSLD
ncbi:hypothetical protein A3840_08460 [Devosia elaeis]|uniref:Uncharacterized protein n=1 Tax=Devosia elaeis TaxID=1770058 RepID=A0A178HYL8_9HYPH|nr:hypothetical protein A3840_08460 [Devosia elaeis]